MRGCVLKLTIAFGALVVVVAGVIVVVTLTRTSPPACTVGAGSDTRYTFTPEQTANAATISAVGTKLGLPPHAATIALATALQESELRNLDGGDRDSVGLFQQRPSQGWGTPDQLHDPVYAATAFYQRLVKLPNWQTMAVTEAAQAVQRSAAPDAYAQWESQARAFAAAFNGQFPAALTCRNLKLGPPGQDLATVATEELGTAQLSGSHPDAQGWTIASWLVAHAATLGIDKVSFAGKTWTADTGTWTDDQVAGQALSLHQVPATTPSP